MRFSEQTAPLVPDVANWFVLADGYRWVDARDPVMAGLTTALGREAPKEPHLRPAVLKWPAPGRATFPLADKPTLCRTLAELDPDDQAALLAFANEHGLLTVAPGDFLGSGRGEPLRVWHNAIHDVRGALALLDARAPAALARWIEWRPGAALLVREGGAERLELTDDRRRQLESGYHLQAGDSRTAARLFAQRLVNRGLAEHARPRLLLNPRRRGALELRIAPANLLGMIWLQIARLAEGGVTHRVCAAPGCGKWFSVGLGIARIDKQTCGSAACRKRLERARNRRASRLVKHPRKRSP